jgi:hypothetical protein
LATDDRLLLEVARQARFGQLYLRDGVTENGRRILSAGGRSILNCMARRGSEEIVSEDAYQARFDGARGYLGSSIGLAGL